MQALRDAAAVALHLISPPRCAACACLCDGDWCARCAQRILHVPQPVCQRCGAPVCAGVCPECSVRSLPLDAIRAACLYTGSVRQAVLQLKYRRRPACAGPLADLMADAWGVSGLPAPDALVPVPLHAQRQRVRGYNQSELLARRLSVQTGFPVWRDVLLRTARTGPQARLGLDERSRNIAGAFEASRPLTGAALMLVDDVWTTGSTLAEAARTLINAGADRVLALTVAHELRADALCRLASGGETDEW